MRREESTIKIQSFIKVGDSLVPVEEFSGPVPDVDYIEGAIELSIGGGLLLTRQQVDYTDQLWAYLIEGLEKLATGSEFTTYYPDIPVKIVLRPCGDRVTISVDVRTKLVEASASLEELCCAMTSAGTRFFERLRQFVPDNRSMYDEYIARLATLSSQRCARV